MLNLGILISGRGSNMEAIIRAVKRRKIPARPAVVISSSAGAAGLAVAKKLGVQSAVVEPAGESRTEYDGRIMEELAGAGVRPGRGLVCLAGFMRIIGPEFVARYRNRILNIHPSLLPAFPGLDAQGQALRYGARYTGCTVHIVDDGIDTGPVVAQGMVRIEPGDTVGSLSARILEQEHRAYPAAVEMFARGMVRVRGGRAYVSARRKSTLP